MKKTALGFLLSSVAVFSGCLGLAVAGGAVAGVMICSYVGNELECKYPKDYETVYQATIKALEQLQFEVSPEGIKKDALDCRIDVRKADGTPILIKIKREPRIQDMDVTSVSVRVGTEGNKATSQFIHDYIKKNLNIPD